MEPTANTAPTASLYTELPYPADGVPRTTNARILLAGIQDHAPRMLLRDRLRLVDVGCGTGENTVSFRRFVPNAEVLGVDINPASLKLARELAAKVAPQTQFVQCDISSNLAPAVAAVSPGPFDVVCSIGVLHHLAEPRVGFSAVRDLMADEGLFYCFVYTHYGRREEMAIKEILTETLPKGISWKERASAITRLRLENRHRLWAGLKRIPRRLKFGPPLRPVEMAKVLLKRNRVVHESDTYSNPCEHLYRFADLEALLDDTGWKFVALARHAGLPTRPEEHTKRPAEIGLLKQMSAASLYDYFAFYYEAEGFAFFCRPK